MVRKIKYLLQTPGFEKYGNNLITVNVNQTCVTTLEKIFINMKDSFLPFHDHFYCAYV